MASELRVSYASHPMISPLHDRMNAFERRMARMERAIGAILEKLGAGKLEDFNERESEKESRFEAQQQELGCSPVVEASKGPYTYQPLDPKRSEIRVFCLRTNLGRDTRIEGELVHVSLDEKVEANVIDRAQLVYRARRQYRALSYVWGSQSENATISLNGRGLQITKSLESALRHMRKNVASPGSAQYLVEAYSRTHTFWWVDQICIDQANVDERNQQVELMRRIYKNAYLVHVWLGEEADDSDLAMQVIDEIGPVFARAPGEKPPEYPEHDENEKLRYWRALHAFFRRSWWERSWIRQEVALARFASFFCGSASCQFEVVIAAAKALALIEGKFGYEPRTSAGQSHEQDGISIPRYWHAELLGGIRHKVAREKSFIGLIDLLLQSRSCKASDARDKVFSLLGLVDPEVYNISADYRMTTEETFREAAKEVLSKEFGLDLLRACQYSMARTQPSWVPNFNLPWTAEPFPRNRSDPRYIKQSDIRIEDNAILVSGHIAGKINEFSRAVVRAGATAAEIEATYRQWQTDVAEVHAVLDAAGVLKDQPYDLRSTTTDAEWLVFLSAGTEDTYNLHCSESGEFLLRSEQELLRDHPNINFKLIRAYLLPGNFFQTVSPRAPIFAAMRKYSVGRRLAFSAKGAVALVPAETRIGDSLALLKGAPNPIIVRKEDEGQEAYAVVGEAFMASRTFRDRSSGKDRCIRLI